MVPRLKAEARRCLNMLLVLDEEFRPLDNMGGTSCRMEGVPAFQESNIGQSLILLAFSIKSCEETKAKMC